MKTRLAVFVVAACLALAGCFTSQEPLFNARRGEAILGRGHIFVDTYRTGEEKPETGELVWTPEGYVEPGRENEGAMSFHHLPGSGWFSPWYVGQSKMGSQPDSGYMYLLYRRKGGRVLTYNLSCTDLSAEEAAAAHLVRSESGQECKATRADDLAQAFRLLAKRKQPEGYMVARRAK